MKLKFGPVAGVLLAFVFLATTAWTQTFGSELDLGVAAYRQARYEEAVQHFRKAAELDPSRPVAQMYLATALVSQYIPGVDTKENVQLAEEAIEHYQRVLESDAPVNLRIDSAKGIGYLFLNMKKWEDAKHYYQRASGFDSNDPEPYYSVGVLDWTECYQPRMEARAQLDMKPDESLDAKNPKQKKICDELKAKSMPLVEEGIDNLNKAIQLRPDYDDAMAYMNLMYRERADLKCDDLAAQKADLRVADHWVDMTLKVKKAKAQKADQQLPTAPNLQ